MRVDRSRRVQEGGERRICGTNKFRDGCPLSSEGAALREEVEKDTIERTGRWGVANRDFVRFRAAAITGFQGRNRGCM